MHLALFYILFFSTSIRTRVICLCAIHNTANFRICFLMLKASLDGREPHLHFYFLHCQDSEIVATAKFKLASIGNLCLFPLLLWYLISVSYAYLFISEKKLYHTRLSALVPYIGIVRTDWLLTS
jgi:hypothetical protein